MSEVANNAWLIGLIITALGVWWRMDAFRDKLDKLRSEQDDKRTSLMLRAVDDIANLAQRVTRLEKHD